jgi:hypothetical protein
MAIINLNDTTPAAPTGKVNVKWQADASTPRNVSAYVDLPVNPTAVSETPAGTMNGSNPTFNLSFAPNPAASLLLVLNGLVQIPSVDFTITGAVITYTVAPRATDLHNAWYSH